MNVHLVDANYDPVELLRADPVCGEAFCDQCGDCLRCYVDDPCYHSSDGLHSWVIYAHGHEAWRAGHPEATPADEP